MKQTSLAILVRRDSLQLKAVLILLSLTGLLQAPKVTAAEADPDAAEKLSMINKLFTVVHLEESINHRLDEVLKRIEAPTARLVHARFAAVQGLSSEEKEQKEAAATKFMMTRYRQLLQDVGFAKEIEKIDSQLIDKNMSLREVKELVAFYESPTGKKSIEIQSQVQANVAQQIKDQIMPKALRIMAELKKENDEQVARELGKAKDPSNSAEEQGKANDGAVK